MSDERPSELLSALPRSRPHRRSDKRPVRSPAAPEAETSSPGPQKTEASAPARQKRSARGDARATRKTASSRPKAAATQRSVKPRGAATAEAASRRRPRRLAQPAQPGGVPRGVRGPRPEPSTEFPVVRTAVQAAAELAEIGFTLSTKVLRRAIGRLPRP